MFTLKILQKSAKHFQQARAGLEERLWLHAK